MMFETHNVSHGYGTRSAAVCAIPARAGRAWRRLLAAACLLLPLSSDAVTPPALPPLSYVVTFQGLLSAGIPLDIATIRLAAEQDGADADGPRRVWASMSTGAYRKAELLVPVRFCYSSRMQQADGTLLESDWWSRVGDEEARGHLAVDRDGKRLVRRHAKRKLGSVQRVSDPVDEWLQPVRAAPQLKQERHELPFSDGRDPLDAFGMLWWLRRQDLHPGQVLEVPVNNGKNLTGYRVVVEGDEAVEFAGRREPSQRLRLEPHIQDDADAARPLWLWLSRDERRLPLLLRSSRLFGSFEARLRSAGTDAPMRCEIPDSQGLDLPAS